MLRNKAEEGVAKVIIRNASESPEVTMTDKTHAYNGVIYFHKSTLSKEYRTKLAIHKYELYKKLNGDSDALNRIEYAFPLYNRFSLQRTLMHEFQHAANSWSMFGHEMKEAINPTNDFMLKYYSEPMRLDHKRVRNASGNTPLIHKGFKPQELW